MNHIYRTVWNHRTQTMTAVAENARGRGKSGGKSSSTPALLASVLAAACAIPAGAAPLNVLPTGGQVSAGVASISSTADTLTVNQGSQRAAINWQNFSVGSSATVNFRQPNASSVTLNRVVGTEQSVIAGAVNANGQVFLLNSNGVLFTGTASVNVGGLVASTLNLNDADFMAGRSTFSANGSRASVINLGTINAADGGYVALLGKQVTNEGVITARLGSAILGAGDKVSLNFNGDSLVGVTIDQGTLNGLVENKQAIRADGGLVVLTAKGLDAVMATVVNNTGEIRAQTVASKEGKVYLLGGMENNRIEVGGTLDASAPGGGKGGFIETSAASVKITDSANITTRASSGQQGKWLIDPLDFTIAATGGDITGTALGGLLGTNSIQIETATSPTATPANLVGNSGTNGDINVNDAVSWSANNTLTLSAFRNININRDMTSSGASGKLALYYGQGAVASGNTATYNLRGGHVNLKAGQNFETRLGNDGAPTQWTVITELGSAGSTTGTDLQGLYNGVTGSFINSRTGNFVLGANIDARATATWNSDGSGGYYGYQFTNASNFALDGLGHTIDALYINRPGAGSPPPPFNQAVNVGLIGFGGNITLRNLGLTNANITGTAATGGLIGRVLGGTASIDQSYVTGSVSGSVAVGGLVGRDTSGLTLSNSYSLARVSGSSSNVGGLVGEKNVGVISNSYASGPVSGGSNVGGLVGKMFTLETRDLSGNRSTGAPVGSISNSYFDTTTTGQTVAYNYNMAETSVPTSNPATNVTANTGGITNADAYTQGTYAGFDFTSTGPWFAANGYTRPLLRMEATNAITNAHQLQLLSMNVASNYTLANNIDLAPSLANKSEIWKDNSASVNYSNYKGSFVPVMGLITVVPGDPNLDGSGNFRGQLDGLSNTIDHLYIDRPLNSHIGLFADGAGATFKNIGLTNVDVTGSGYVGGLVGYHSISGFFSAPTMSNVFVTGSVASNFSQYDSGNFVGGLAGYAKGTITNSHSTATLTGNVSYMGGLVGQNDAIITNSYATGNVSGTGIAGVAGGASQYIGGLVGKNDAVQAAGTIQSTGSGFSYATGNVSGVNYVGGLVGWNGTTGTITGAYATGNATGTGDSVGGLAGKNSKTITSSYATGTVNGNTSVGALVGTNDLTGVISNSHAQGAVTGTYNFVGGLAGSNYHTISGSYSTSTVTGGDTVGGLIGYNFGGVVSASNHTTGLVQGGMNVGGLIGQSTASGSAVSDSYSSGNVTSNGNGAGGLIGDAQFTRITNSHSSATVSGGAARTGGLVGNAGGVVVSDSYATGVVTGASADVGGLVGHDSSGNYSRTYATGPVDGGAQYRVGGLVGYALNTHIDTSYATGTVHGGSSVGGLVGYMEEAFDTIENSYATGAVTGTITDTGGLIGTVLNSTVTNAYSTGLTTGVTNVGGLIGRASGSNITNSFWDNQTSGRLTSSGGAGVTGKTTAEMKSIATFSGTTPAWNIVVDPSLTDVYPQLRWATTGLNAGSTIWVIGRGLVTYIVAGGAKTYGQSFTLPTPSFAGGTPTATPTVKVVDSANNDVTSQAQAGTLPVGSYTVKTLLADTNYQLATTGNTNGTLTVGQASVNYSVPGGTKTYGQSFALPTPSFTGGSPTATPAVKVFDSSNNDVTSQATAGTLPVGSYTVKTLLTDTNFQLASSGNTTGTLTIGQASVNYGVAGGSRTYGQSFTLPTPSFTGGSPTATPTVKVFDSSNNDVTSQATAGTLPVGSYIVKATLVDTNYQLASEGNSTGTLTVGPASLNYAIAGGARAVGQPFVLPAPSFTGGNPTATPTVKVFDSSNNDVTSQATAGTLPVGSYTVKTLLTDTNFQLASSGNTNGTLTVGLASVNYSIAGGIRTYGQTFTLPTPSFTGGTPTATPTVKVFDSSNNDVTSQAIAGTLPVGSYTVKAMLADTNYQLASEGNANGTLTVGPASLNYAIAGGARTVGQAFTLPAPSFTGGSPSATPTVKVVDSANNDVTSQALAGTLAAGTYTVKTLLTDANYQLAGSGNTDGILTVTSAVTVGETGPTDLGNAIANAITTPYLSQHSSSGQPVSPLFAAGAAPDSGQPQAFVNVTNPLPEVSASFGPGERFAVIASPGASEPTQAVTLSQARIMMQAPGQNGGSAGDGDREVRVPVSRNSLVDIVNGGVKLPDGVEQQMFVVQAN